MCFCILYDILILMNYFMFHKDNYLHLQDK